MLLLTPLRSFGLSSLRVLQGRIDSEYESHVTPVWWLGVSSRVFAAIKGSACQSRGGSVWKTSIPLARNARRQRLPAPAPDGHPVKTGTPLGQAADRDT